MNLTTRLSLAALALLEDTRAGNALSALFANRYEAAQPGTPRRSWVPAFVRDARFDANSFTRWELVRKIRYFERNTWLVQRLRDEFKKWTVGPNGLQVVPASSDRNWNARALDSYLAWSERPVLDATISMGQAHGLIAGEFSIDGELFVHKTRRKTAGKASEPAIQLIEGHRVSTPGTMFATQEQLTQVDGVEIDSRGSPLGYWVRDDFAGEAWTFRSTSDMLHVFDPERVGMYRGITPYHASLNTLHDLDDLELMEMERAKQNSEIANVLKNPAGELNPTLLRRQRFLQAASIPPGNQTPDDELAKRIEMYRTVLGSRTIALKTGEELEQFDSKQPSAATQWYWRYKIAQVCAAAGVPMILVFPELIETMQGTAVRGIYDNAHLFFRSKYFVFATIARDIYRFYLQWARYNVAGLTDGPADWAKCHVIPPRAVNVDVGRNSAAMLAELAAGVTNYDDVAGANGTTAEVLLRKKAANVKLIHEIADEEGIEAAEIAAPLADILQKLAAAEASDSDGSDQSDDSDKPGTARGKGKARKPREEEVPA